MEQSIEEIGQFVSCATPTVVIDQEMTGNYIALHLRDLLKTFQRLDDRGLQPLAVRSGQREGSAFERECLTAPGEHADQDCAHHEPQAPHS